MANDDRYRYRITFTKDEAQRYTSHLDLHRAWGRLLRRARLPLLYSKGFNPRPRIQLSTALPLGCTSEHELADIWLTEEIPYDEIQERLQHSAPPGTRILTVEFAALNEPALPSQIDAVSYIVQIDADLIEEELSSAIHDLLLIKVIERERRGKTYDLRPLIHELEISSDGMEHPSIRMKLAAKEGATGRPEEVLLALDLDPSMAKIHRIHLHMIQT
ncbi:MAG: TIGR03936 family radical SAM-associated protein [Anaerolineales bacterium]